MAESGHNAALSVHRRLRVIAILAATEECGLSPLRVQQVHAVAYFADALAPVGDLRILDGYVLKESDGPRSPAFQHEIDWLVGHGVLVASSVSHRKNSGGKWLIDADYGLNEPLARPILEAASEFPSLLKELRFLREVVFAISGFGALGIASASASDAAYGDRGVDFGNLVYVEGEGSEPNQTSQVALRIGELLAPGAALSDAEKIHLYVRELGRRLVPVE
jgi:hypothetical protein